jgi:hypothetical protein
MLAKTQVEALRMGEAVGIDQRNAKRRLKYNLAHALRHDRAGRAISDYLAEPTANAAVLVYSEELDKNFSFKRASLARDLDVTASSFHIPTRAVDPAFARLSMDGLNNKLAAIQQSAHGSRLDGFFLAVPLTNIAQVDKATEVEFARLFGLGFRDERKRVVIDEVLAHIQDAMPPDRNWKREVMLAYADGELAERMARDFARLEENNARVQAYLARLPKTVGIDRLVAASQGTFALAAKLWTGLFLGLRDTVEEVSITTPDGTEIAVKLRAPSTEDALKAIAANDNLQVTDDDGQPPNANSDKRQ